VNPVTGIALLLAGAALGAIAAGSVVWLARRPAAPAAPPSTPDAAQQQQALRDAFQALAAQALRDSNAQFLDQAKRVLEGTLGEATRQSRGDLDQRREAIDQMVRPVQEALGSLQGEIRKIEGRREEAFTGLQNEIARLQRETGNLTTALRRPQGRGLWGEITLRRVVEAAGMSAHCDFTEQSTLEDKEGRRYRPDLIVHLPGNRNIVVDSKTPLDAYLDAVNADSETVRNEALVRHAAQVRKQMEELSGKEYWSRLENSPEFVVLFLPGESFFSAALEQDRTLIEMGIERRVILATPTTLIAVLKAVSYGWRQEQVTDNARRIGELGATLYERLANLTGHLREVGESLERSTASYNKAVGSYNSRVLVTAGKLHELGTIPAPEIPPLEEIDVKARTAEVSQQSLELLWPEKPTDGLATDEHR
jgi:DNA recombination protein RmuC